MLTDSHCHPFDLSPVFPQAEEKRRRLGVMAAASAYGIEEFAHNETLAKKAADEKQAPLLPCFAVHPQFPAAEKTRGGMTNNDLDSRLETLAGLAKAGRLAAVGEFGFDFYNSAFRETEAIQDRLFAIHMEVALKHDLPVVLHIRRAVDRIFANAKSLAKCKAVVFHSWPAALEEGNAILRRGINAYFSFGNIIMKEHKKAMRCCALSPAERILTETDAPYQPRFNESFSQWEDLPLIIEAACALRREAQSPVSGTAEFENQIEENFRRVFLS